VQYPPPGPGQLAEQAQRHDTLARPRAAEHQNDRLGVLVGRGLDRLLHDSEGDLLLVQQHELLALPDLISCVCQKLA
jgi:hypothetical protein